MHLEIKKGVNHSPHLYYRSKTPQNVARLWSERKDQTTTQTT